MRSDYATEIVPGPCQIRPWQLGYRSDFGFSGFCEPDESELLLQLIVSEGSGSQRLPSQVN